MDAEPMDTSLILARLYNRLMATGNWTDAVATVVGWYK